MKPVCKLIGQNGNVFNLIGITRKTLKFSAVSKLTDSSRQGFKVAVLTV